MAYTPRAWLICKEIKCFIHVSKLEELLEKFADAEIVADLKEAIRAKSEEVLSFVKENVGQQSFLYRCNVLGDVSVSGLIADCKDFQFWQSGEDTSHRLLPPDPMRGRRRCS